MALQLQDLLDALDSCRYVSDACGRSFDGAYLVAPDGEINWYFANLGLNPFVAERTDAVQAYLDAYIRNCDPQHWTIKDFDPSAPCAYMPPDSDDSYAATFLSLVAEWMNVSKNAKWLKINLKTLLYIGRNNLLNSQKKNGLVSSFQASSTAPPNYKGVSQFEDNCEVGRGLEDFIKLLTAYGHIHEAEPFQTALTRLSCGLLTMRSATALGELAYASSQDATGINATPETKFYPDCVTQIFPQAFQIFALQQDWACGYDFLNRHAASWPSQDPDGTAQGFPWAMVGYVAAMRRDWDCACKQLAHIETMLNDSSLRSKVTINELGWCRKILDLQ